GAGNLVETIAGGRTLFSTGTATHPGSRAVMQVNGSLVIYDPTNTAVYSTNSPTVGCPRLIVQNDGNVVIYGSAKAGWADGAPVNKMLKGDLLKSGWSLYSRDPEAYRLTMLADGNLALFDGSGTELWGTKTWGHPSGYTPLQTSRHHLLVVQHRPRPVVECHQRQPRRPPRHARRWQRRHHRHQRHGAVAQQDLPQGLRGVA